MLLLGFRGFRRINKRAFVSFGHLGLMAAVALGSATVVGGSGYLIHELHREARIAGAAVGLTPADPTNFVPVSSDMLNISSIALGRGPVAIVNGVEVGEGETIRLQTPIGTATLRVVSIRDGFIQFKNGEQTIFANQR